VLARSDHEFLGDEIRAAMTMGDYIAIALSNARMYQRMQMRAEIDHLSGVLTRQAFMELGEKEIDGSFHASKPVSCLMLDIDHFKSINDTYGHAVGDEVIRTLGSVLQEGLRSTDIVGRFGGEEFCAVLPETPVEIGLEVAERLRRTIEESTFIGVDRAVTASIGLAGMHNDGKDPSVARLTIEQLITCADAALYSAKESGRNKVVEGDPSSYREENSDEPESQPATSE
jgi:diguanylate cyclase (GGDEF)-like protein